MGDAEFWNIRQAVDQLVGLFVDLVLLDQDCFKEEDKWRELLQLIPDAKIVKNLEKKWAHSEDRSSEDKWADLKAEIRTSYSKDDRVSPRDFVDRLGWTLNGLLKAPMMYAMEDIVLQYAYPRIDAEVSKHRNHLLKAPFCVHPKTGRICVPVDPERIDEFDPELVPTVGQLLRELDATISESTGEEHSGRFFLSPPVGSIALMALMSQIGKKPH